MPRQFWLLTVGLVVLVTGIDISLPFQTSYLTQELGIPITTVGLVLGIPALLVLPFHIVGGMLVDRFGRKTAMLIGGAFMILFYGTFALAHTLWPIAIVVSLEAAFGWALFLTGSNAMVADLIPYQRRAEAYSLTRVATYIAMIIGPLLAGLILTAGAGYRPLFLASVCLCGAFVVLVVSVFRDTASRSSTAPASFTGMLGEYGGVLCDRRFLAFCAAALFPLYGFGQIWTTLPVALHDAHGVSARDWSLLVVIYAVTVTILQYPLIRVLRNRDPLLLMATCSVLLCGGLAGTTIVPLGVLTILCMTTVGFGSMLLMPISASVAAALAPPHLRGRYMATWTLAQTGGYALGPTFGGWALGGLGSLGAAAVLAACGAVGATAFLILRCRLGQPQPPAAIATHEVVAPATPAKR